ncbi:Xanthine dehydrogenase/oxidase [Manis javanica]|nr:Xanthine dehydrogenase/oxidase [Manis javanica]
MRWAWPRTPCMWSAAAAQAAASTARSQSALFACVASVAAARLRRPVKLRLDRDDDFMITGRRHCFWYEYEVVADNVSAAGGQAGACSDYRARRDAIAEFNA